MIAISRAASVATLCACLASTARAADAFHFSAPSGWKTLVPDDGISTDGLVPRELIVEAMSGRFTFYAVDAKADRSNPVRATFTAAEVPSTLRVDSELLEQYAAGVAAQAPPGVRIRFDDMRIVKVHRVPSGMFAGILTRPEGTDRLVQYLVPGRTRSAVLSFKCANTDFDRYRTVFEEAALATEGAYDHGGYDWGRTVFMGAMGGLAAIVLGLVDRFQKRKGGPPPMASASVSAPPAPPVVASPAAAWECPGCHRRVPARIAQCRCGVGRPGE